MDNRTSPSQPINKSPLASSVDRLPAFAAVRCCWALSIDMSRPHGAQQQTCRMLLQRSITGIGRQLTQVGLYNGCKTVVIVLLLLSIWHFYPRDTMLLQVVAMALCLSACLSLNCSWTNQAGFWHGSFIPPILYCVKGKFGYLQKWGYFPLQRCPKLSNWNILLQHIDRRNV